MIAGRQEFTFVDLFAGIGGFHAALAALGGRCVYAAELDDAARAVYKAAWQQPERARGIEFPFARDINADVPVVAEAELVEAVHDLPNFPDHDVLAAGFPCQAFSKSGRQQGVLDATRGTLFYNILRIVRAKRPKIVFLENVRNLAGPKHRTSTFKTIVDSLFDLGYVVSDEPTVISPHRVHPDQGGTPQLRERIYIMAIHRTALGTDIELSEERIRWTDDNWPFVNDVEAFSSFSYGTWEPQEWRIRETALALYGGEPVVLPDERIGDRARLELSTGDSAALKAWDAFVRRVVERRGLREGDGVRRLPGHPIWTGVLDPLWLARERADANARAQEGSHWKNAFLESNIRMAQEHRADLDATVMQLHGSLPESRWKFEWQAQDASSLDECLVQLRPSGIRVKKDTYTPALVAINQTPILGKERRRLAPAEAARLQGFPDAVAEVMVSIQADAKSYKQLGNAVHVGAVGFALAQFIDHFGDEVDPSLRSIKRRWDEWWTNGPSNLSAQSHHGADLPVESTAGDERAA